MSDVGFRKEGKAGRITLNRPDALNALTHEMVLAMEAALLRWRDDAAIGFILIEGAGARAFCAGGDIQDLYTLGRAGDFAYGRQFWRDEYRLNALIANYKKPFVALMDGIAMGGGVGVCVHGSHRIVSERAQVAMPECAIGLAPDVGGSGVLARAPGHLGEYLGMTGARMGAGDAIYAGFADAYVPSDAYASMVAAMIHAGNPDAARAFYAPPPEGELQNLQPHIDDVFSCATALDIVRALETSTDDWAAVALRAMRRACPLSVACALEIIRHARTCEKIEDVLAFEYRFTSRATELGDFLEGIRAQVIDKDRVPRWHLERLEDIRDEDIRRMLKPVK